MKGIERPVVIDATAGITDARVVVAAPFEVSGTAALTGVYKAYEDLTGKKLDDLAKAVSTQELTITGELANEIGEMDSTSIVNDLKMMLDETAQMTDEEILSLLATDGMLVKRPMLILNDRMLVGFREAEWAQALGVAQE